ncbi:hypothetical protein [Jannaschia marina]|uniref:hypothetical protein n=1 Tax=Jannaschia marina TaxID=2741674 RepID=UPI0015CC0177|nr:hypothetical protein [Jannaschia marina]
MKQTLLAIALALFAMPTLAENWGVHLPYLTFPKAAPSEPLEPAVLTRVHGQ